jgi:D-alanyl-D-alanine carboxypeptidase (penicillin-binding protein 5/6)
VVRRPLSLAAALAAGAALVSAFVVAGPAGAQAPAPVPPAAPIPAAAASVLVDLDTGAVISGANDRTPMRVASVFKVLTALVAVEHTPPETMVPVSPLAESMPARKMNLKAGQEWRFDDLLHALLMVSANDAAVALGEQAGGGTLAGFDVLLEETASRLGLADNPTLRDPAGLDDEFSYLGGNKISARDLAIATQTAMTYPEITDVVVTPEYRFSGGDGNPHRIVNHNAMLKTYAGAIGVKTGATKRAGQSLIAAARRNGRTMLAVVIRGDDKYATASALLDRGFATPVRSEAPMDHLPPVARAGTAVAAKAAVTPVPTAAPPPVAAAASTTSSRDPVPRGRVVLLAAGLAPVLAVVALRRRAVRRRRRRRLALSR